MRKELRYFQSDAIDAILKALKNKDSVPYVNAVTGFGKSIVMADITERALKKKRRVLQLVPNHTLCVQNYEQTFNYSTDKATIGICSAKVGKFQTLKQVVIATQTSFLRRRATSGAFDILLIDECDMVSHEHGTTYQKIIRSLMLLNPSMRIIGLTGSPWRQDQGAIHDPIKDGNVIFTECCYESDIPRLIEEGYLSSVQVLNTHVSVDLDGVKMKGADYDQEQCGVKFDAIVTDAVADFKQLFIENGIKTALIFASTIANGKRIVDEYGNNAECRLAHGELSNHDRNELIHWLKEGSGNRYLVNVGLYTRGFDFPGLESLVLLRATTSLRLYVQIIGRLLRTHDEKAFGYIADYGTNIDRFGPIDNLTPPKPPRAGVQPKKLCMIPTCGEENLLSAKKCKKCGAEFISLDESGNYQMRTKEQALQAKRDEATVTYEVSRVVFERTYSKKDAIQMIKMLFIDEDGVVLHSHYLCLDHTGFAKEKAKNMLRTMLKTIADYPLLAMADGGICVDNVMPFFEDDELYEKYFKQFATIAVAPGVNSKLKELVRWTMA